MQVVISSTYVAGKIPTEPFRSPLHQPSSCLSCMLIMSPAGKIFTHKNNIIIKINDSSMRRSLHSSHDTQRYTLTALHHRKRYCRSQPITSSLCYWCRVLSRTREGSALSTPGLFGAVEVLKQWQILRKMFSSRS